MGATCCTEKINEMEIQMKKQADDKVKGAIETQLPLTPEYATPYHPLGIKGTRRLNSAQESGIRKQLAQHERLQDGLQRV